MEECDSIALKTKGCCTFSYCARKYDILSKRQSVYLKIGTQCASFLAFREDALYVEALERSKPP